jgi:hypothetical protein
VDTADQVPLATLAPGEAAVVRRIDEEIEARPDAMRDLEAELLMPGCAVTVVGADGDDLRLRSDRGECRLPAKVAAKVYVSR